MSPFEAPSNRHDDKRAELMLNPAAGSHANKFGVRNDLNEISIIYTGAVKLISGRAPDLNTMSNYARRFFNLFNRRLLCR